MATDSIKEVLRCTLQGDFGIIWAGTKRKLENQIPDTFEYICDEELPCWIRSGGTLQTIHLTDSEYVPLLVESAGLRFTIDSEQAIRAIEVPIIAPEKANNVHISQVEYGLDEAKIEFKIQIEESYDYPSIVWRTLKVSEDSNVSNVHINIDQREPQLKRFLSIFQKLSNNQRELDAAVGLPALVPTEKQPSVFLISIDALRFDQQEELSSLIDELGSDTIFPTEPRTQGTWTPPSHASMFTGTHPGEHGYVGYGKVPADKRPINPDLTTISEILMENGYKNSALVSHSRILPEFGFGRGFHRFRHDGMGYADWVTRNNDAKASVNQVIDWIEQDITVRDHSLFYFLHVFDPHYPFIPPIERIDSPDIDFSKSKAYRNQMNKAMGDEWTYLDGYLNEYDLEPELVQEIKDWYSKSTEYTGDQIARFLKYLKAKNLFDDSLIIITGDHGEEFGERGFFEHTSLYDENIRPFMAVKPPRGESWPKRDCINTIDFLPTIACLTGQQIPEYCRGTPIQKDIVGTPRFTERIYPDWYNLAVEINGIKGIFTYDSNYPDRPTQDVIQHGPELEEYYELSSIRMNNYSEKNIEPEVKSNLQELCKEFLFDKSVSYNNSLEASRPSQETIDQLRSLGYK